jgi:hypothetical protein
MLGCTSWRALFLGVFFAMQSGTLDSMVYDTVVEETADSGLFESTILRVRFVESAALMLGVPSVPPVGGLLRVVDALADDVPPAHDEDICVGGGRSGLLKCQRRPVGHEASGVDARRDCASVTTDS